MDTNIIVYLLESRASSPTFNPSSLSKMVSKQPNNMLDPSHNLELFLNRTFPLDRVRLYRFILSSGSVYRHLGVWEVMKIRQ